jgi:hypothetical protein
VFRRSRTFEPPEGFSLLRCQGFGDLAIGDSRLDFRRGFRPWPNRCRDNHVNGLTFVVMIGGVGGLEQS